MKKFHIVILLLVIVYVALSHVTNRIELDTLRERSERLELLLIEQGIMQKQILDNQSRIMSSRNQPVHTLPYSGPDQTPPTDLI